MHLWNRTRCGKTTRVTAWESLRGKKPSSQHLAVFGTDVWCLVPKEQRGGTYGDKMEAGVYLGHDDRQGCPIVYLLRTGKEIRSRDVKFIPSFLHAASLQGGREAVDRVVRWMRQTLPQVRRLGRMSGLMYSRRLMALSSCGSVFSRLRGGIGSEWRSSSKWCCRQR